MMEVFSIDVTQNELMFLRQSLDLVNISGKDAKFLASLQTRLENELAEIERMKRDANTVKMNEFKQIEAEELQKKETKKK